MVVIRTIKHVNLSNDVQNADGLAKKAIRYEEFKIQEKEIVFLLLIKCAPLIYGCLWLFIIPLVILAVSIDVWCQNVKICQWDMFFLRN